MNKEEREEYGSHEEYLAAKQDYEARAAGYVPAGEADDLRRKLKRCVAAITISADPDSQPRIREQARRELETIAIEARKEEWCK